MTAEVVGPRLARTGAADPHRTGETTELTPADLAMTARVALAMTGEMLGLPLGMSDAKAVFVDRFACREYLLAAH
jgi:hypothetical protein